MSREADREADWESLREWHALRNELRSVIATEALVLRRLEKDRAPTARARQSLREACDAYDRAMAIYEEHEPEINSLCGFT